MRLIIDRTFRPCPIEVGDECYANGIFEFNITRILAFLDDHAQLFPVTQIALADIADYGGNNLDPDTMRIADLSRPIVLAEIAPNHFNVIDGNHRVGRARRDGMQSISCRKLGCPAHVAFLTSTFAYERYVEYWNSKLASSEDGMTRARRNASRKGLSLSRASH
jgi:hypothetical protein